MEDTYCIDTSSLMDAWVRWYPIDHFPGLWEQMELLIKQGRLISSEEVLHEIERKDDTLHDWVKQRSSMFVTIDDDIQTFVTDIMAEFPKMVDERTGKSFGDPFVIATAQANKATVITGEGGGSPARPTIPVVCNRYGIRCINTATLIREERWVFSIA